VDGLGHRSLQAALREARLDLWVSFSVRLEARFSAPTRAWPGASRAGRVKVGRRPDGSAGAGVSRPRLGAAEHDAMLGAVGAEPISTPAAVNVAKRCGPRNTPTVASGYSCTCTVALTK
jgi:hypothetical protein